MTESGGLWKHQNNPAGTKSVSSLQNVEVGHYRAEEEEEEEKEEEEEGLAPTENQPPFFFLSFFKSRIDWVSGSLGQNTAILYWAHSSAGAFLFLFGVWGGVCVYVCACVRARARAYVCVCVCFEWHTCLWFLTQ